MTRTRFTLDLQQRLAARIDGIPAGETVTWARVQGLAAEMGLSLTRQWLSKSDLVEKAYRSHSEANRLGRHEVDELLGDQPEAVALKKEVVRLRALLVESDKRFIRWLHNATQRRVTIEQLEMPIPELEV